MTWWGIGPKFALLSALLASPLVAAGARWPGSLAIRVVPNIVTTVAGGALLAAGISVVVVATMTLHRRFREGKLFTDGIYAICRNPIYAGWTLFIVPGALLLAGTWMFVLVPLTMCVALRLLIRREEERLEETFGDEYRAYRKRVPAVVPLPPWRR
jgi:protein-S-isoprenylcysteine O-methyltransferase Ste14